MLEEPRSTQRENVFFAPKSGAGRDKVVSVRDRNSDQRQITAAISCGRDRGSVWKPRNMPIEADEDPSVEETEVTPPQGLFLPPLPRNSRRATPAVNFRGWVGGGRGRVEKGRGGSISDFGESIDFASARDVPLRMTGHAQPFCRRQTAGEVDPPDERSRSEGGAIENAWTRSKAAAGGPFGREE